MLNTFFFLENRVFFRQREKFFLAGIAIDGNMAHAHRVLDT